MLPFPVSCICAGCSVSPPLEGPWALSLQSPQTLIWKSLSHVCRSWVAWLNPPNPAAWVDGNVRDTKCHHCHSCQQWLEGEEGAEETLWDEWRGSCCLQQLHHGFFLLSSLHHMQSNVAHHALLKNPFSLKAKYCTPQGTGLIQHRSCWKQNCPVYSPYPCSSIKEYILFSSYAHDQLTHISN